jgi:hypothetical protein
MRLGRSMSRAPAIDLPDSTGQLPWRSTAANEERIMRKGKTSPRRVECSKAAELPMALRQRAVSPPSIASGISGD